MSAPLVSVVIPTYNRALRVQRAIRSALDQTHDRIEVVVVDDGSTDRTVEAIEDRFGPEPRLTVIRTENRGVSAARNTGIAASTGTHVAFLDSDDEWFPWKLELQLACLERVPEAGTIWSDMRAIDADGLVVSKHYLRTFYHHHQEIDIEDVLEGPLLVEHPDVGTCRLWHGDLYRAMLGGNLIHTSTVLMTRERVAAVGDFDVSLVRTGEDFDFHLRSAAAGPVAFLDVPTIDYRIGAPDQLTRPDLMVQMATNYLTTIEKAAAADRGRSPASVLRRSIAGAHGWLGEELLESGLRHEAGPHLRAAIRGPKPIRATFLYALTVLPAAPARALRWFAGRVTRPFRRRSAG